MSQALRVPDGYRVIEFDDIDSTNLEAARQAAAGAPDGTVIWAKAQTGGRGRRGRAWASPAGNLYCSILMRPTEPAQTATQIGFVVSLAGAEAARGALPADRLVALKWPNDILVSGRKVAGILLESQSSAPGRLDWLVAGFGLNVTSHPDVVEYPASDLRAEGASTTARDMLEAYLQFFARWRARWRSEGFAPVRAAWTGLAVGLGRDIKVRLTDETLEGRFRALDDDGGLVLELADGNLRVITSGQVFAIG
jgi:BirA family biotin operon repressor/biotin-[acetyl-CoA-carboxylase] ligase